MSDTTQKIESHASDDLRALLQEAEQALSSTAGEAGEKFDELRSRLRSAIDNGKYSLERMRAEAIRRARQADKLVRENPYYAVGVAAGVGAIVGLLVARRYSHSE